MKTARHHQNVIWHVIPKPVGMIGKLNMVWCDNFYSKECSATNPNICISCVNYTTELIDGHCRCKNN